MLSVQEPKKKVKDLFHFIYPFLQFFMKLSQLFTHIYVRSKKVCLLYLLMWIQGLGFSQQSTLKSTLPGYLTYYLLTSSHVPRIFCSPHLRGPGLKLAPTKVTTQDGWNVDRKHFFICMHVVVTTNRPWWPRTGPNGSTWT